MSYNFDKFFDVRIFLILKGNNLKQDLGQGWKVSRVLETGKEMSIIGHSELFLMMQIV